MDKTYTMVVYLNGKEVARRNELDKLNSIVIAAEMEMAYPKAFADGQVRVEVLED